jgi:hypothetical protein
MHRLISHTIFASLLLLAACAPSGMKPSAEDKAEVSVACDPGQDCQEKWKLARQWVEDNSHFPILRETDDEITTDASSGTLYPVVTIRKMHQEDSASIEFTAVCENLIGCVPSEDSYQKSFSDYVDDLAPPEEESANTVDIGLIFNEAGKGSGGLVVQSVQPGAPAAASGIRAGDRVMKFNGATINTAAKLDDAVKATPEGSMVPLQFSRDGRIYVVYIRL